MRNSMADSRLHALLQEAELHLVNRKYSAAESKATQALHLISSLTDTEKHILGDRASVVLLQALYETNRFASASPSLCETFGSLEHAPPNTLLLWLSLSLDTEDRSQSQALILHLLQTKGSSKEWRRRQYIALLHLYLVEVLLPALRDPSQVRLWLQRQPFVPLDPRERQFLEDEIATAAAEEGVALEDSTTAEVAARRLGTVCSVQTLASSPLTLPTAWARQGRGPQTSRPRSPAAGDGNGGGHGGGDIDFDDATSAHSFGAGGLDLPALPPLSPQRNWRETLISPQQSMNLDASEASGARFGGSGGGKSPHPTSSLEDLDWLGRLQHAAFTAAANIYDGAAGLLRPVGVQREGPETSTGSSRSLGSSSRTPMKAGAAPGDISAVAVGVASAALVYYIYAERDVIKKVLGSAGRGLVRGLSDVVGMGLSVTPNPMAHPR